MERRPRLVAAQEPRAPHGLVLVLHGGGSRGTRVPVSAAQLSVLRMVPTARALARADRGLAVHRVLNSWRGWDAEHSPVDDVAWAAAHLRERYGDLPVGLVGHSLGGRAALLAGQADGVRCVVALNPWVYPTDAPDLSGRRVLVVHGTADVIALPGRSEGVARRIARTADVEFVPVPGGTHAMLRHAEEFDGRAARFTAEALAPA